MARHEIIIDDLDSEPGARPITFSIDGQAYNIDLHEANIKLLNEALAPFVEKATPARGGRPPVVPGRPSVAVRRAQTKNERSKELAKVREWAAKHKIEIGERGRIPGDIIAKYEASRGPLSS